MYKITMLSIISFAVLGCSEKPNPDPNRSEERLLYEQGVIDSCYAKNATSIGRISKEELTAKCDAYFKEKVGYTYTEAQDSLKQRKIPN